MMRGTACLIYLISASVKDWRETPDNPAMTGLLSGSPYLQ